MSSTHGRMRGPLFACCLALVWQGKASLAAASEVVATTEGLPRMAAAQALEQDGSADGLTKLWLCAHDPDHGVVGAALSAALGRCKHESPAICFALLGFFLDGEADEGQSAWRARTSLLAEQPALARLYASRETKLDVVTLLAGRLSQGMAAKPWLAPLELLANDPEPEVQEAAGAVLMQLER